MIITEHVDATEPLITYDNTPEPAEYPSPDVWRELQARVSADGSPEVGEAAGTFYAKARAFFAAASEYRSVRESSIGDFGKAAEKMTAARTEVGAALVELQRLVREDLANL
jgi:hypothetical protein